LRAAFSMAGALGVVMSLWPVDDQAGRRFMQFFYSHLDAGPAEAVRLAQLEYGGEDAIQAAALLGGIFVLGGSGGKDWIDGAKGANGGDG
jgi:hypothetical protein